MERLILYIFVACIITLLSGCKENYSNGEKVGNLIEFTKKGVIWDSWYATMRYGASKMF